MSTMSRTGSYAHIMATRDAGVPCFPLCRSDLALRSGYRTATTLATVRMLRAEDEDVCPCEPPRTLATAGGGTSSHLKRQEISSRLTRHIDLLQMRAWVQWCSAVRYGKLWDKLDWLGTVNWRPNMVLYRLQPLEFHPGEAAEEVIVCLVNGCGTDFFEQCGNYM